MRAEDIKKAVLRPDEEAGEATSMLPGEIPGAAVFHRVLPEGGRTVFQPEPGFMRILFLYEGRAVFRAGTGAWTYGEKAVFVPGPLQTAEVEAPAGARLIEIQWELHDGDRRELARSETTFPVTGRYADAPQYRDPFKSEKTISRAIIPQRTIPRFAMGSVETYGDDLIGQHEHPLLDQFFFSFPENDMDLLLDDIVYPMGGNTLLHIPLGCNHGVSVKGKQCAHYIWIDFLFDEEGAKYLDEVHKATGTMREF